MSVNKGKDPRLGMPGREPAAASPSSIADP